MLKMGEKMKNRELYQAVYRVVASIPSGRVASYGQVAVLAGWPGRARAVGAAMRMTVVEQRLPCHRVVYSSGALAPGDAFGGPGRQRRLLEQEGVAFLKNGYVDMKHSIWR